MDQFIEIAAFILFFIAFGRVVAALGRQSTPNEIKHHLGEALALKAGRRLSDGED